MNLQEFVAETLRQIVKGVRGAQENADCKGAGINPSQYIEKIGGVSIETNQIAFDVAVTAGEKGEIEVVAGKETAPSSVSRVAFRVPVRLPAKE